MRAVKVLAELLKWRWTPTVALLASSLLYVLIALLVVPQSIAVPDASAPKSVNIVNAMDRKNPRPGQSDDDESPPSTPAPGRPQITTPPPPTPITAPAPAPAPAPPPAAEEPRREEAPAPPPPPPAQPAPEQPEEDEGKAPPPNRGSRFAGSPLRVLPAVAAQVQAAAPHAPEPPAPQPEEE